MDKERSTDGDDEIEALLEGENDGVLEVVLLCAATLRRGGMCVSVLERGTTRVRVFAHDDGSGAHTTVRKSTTTNHMTNTAVRGLRIQQHIDEHRGGIHFVFGFPVNSWPDQCATSLSLPSTLH